jgi:SIR2-like domain
MPIHPERNALARRRMVEILRTQRSFAVTGAGLSVWAGYPTWPQFLRRLGDAVQEHRPGEVLVEEVMRTHRDPLHCAARLGWYLGPRLFSEIIRTVFGPMTTPPPPVMFRFIGLPFRHILTFNFEDSVERTHTSARIVCGSISTTSRPDMARFVRDMDSPTYARQVVHLHGLYLDPPERLALTEDGYAALYDDAFYKNLLWLFMTAQRLVFFGFGFRDADFLSRFRDYARHVRDNGICHSAVVGIRPEDDDAPLRAELNESFLIDPVFYPIAVAGGTKDHAGFVDLMNGIATEIGIPEIQLTDDVAAQAEQRGAVDPDNIQQAERLADNFIERTDPGGDHVQD